MRIHPTDFLLRVLLKLLKSFDRRNNALEKMDPDSVRKVLVISSTALGDAVLSTATFRPIRKRFRNAQLVLLVGRQYLSLFSHCSDLASVVPFFGGYREFLRTVLALRRQAPQLALILHGNEPQATPLAYLSGARFIVKLPNANEFRFLLSNSEPEVTWQSFSHGLEQRLAVAAMVGAEVAGARMTLPMLAGTTAGIDALLAADGMAGSRLVGFQCGASSRARMWPAAHFIELGKRLLACNPDVRIVLTGAPEESPYLATIAAGIGGAVVNTASAVPLEALPALVGRLGVLVSGDTGTMHVAFAVGTPVVGLFAVSNPAASGPAYDQDRHVIIYQPCPDHFVRSKSDDQTCISRISVDTVFAATQSVMDRA